ncbi:MAG: desulforedoxin [Candidatus Bathyarchaeia archaeon]
MAKKGAKYKCENCGLVVVVDEECECAACDLICCGAQMKEVKTKTRK